MNKKDIKNIILEEIEDALKEMGTQPQNYLRPYTPVR